MPVYTYTTLDDPSAIGTFAEGINDTSQIVGYYGSNYGFFYSAGSYTTINDPLAAQAYGGIQAYGINATGQIVGTYDDSSSRSHGFLYSGGSYTTIDDPLGVGTTNATGINNAGQIVGSPPRP